MAEIQQARIAGYLNPEIEMEDLQAKAIAKKESAMREALSKYQIANAKEQNRILNVNKKAIRKYIEVPRITPIKPPIKHNVIASMIN